MLLNEESIFSFTSYNRILTKKIFIGDITLGGDAPIRIQTMTNTPTEDVQTTFNQIKLLYEHGAELIRLAVPTTQEVQAIKDISKLLKENKINVPIIADVHFNPKIAELVAPFVQKVRINPGNYVNRSKSAPKKEYTTAEKEQEKQQITKKLVPLLKVCKEYGTAIRIGMNFASLPWRIVNEFGNTPQAMVASAMEFFEICRSENFHQVVFSFKASDIKQTVYANRLYIKEMLEKYRVVYPLHIGITEAGMDEEGIIKSIIGIGILLHDGIGDTIRVSLTGNPINELPVAKKIIQLLHKNIQKQTNSLPYLHNLFTFNYKNSTVNTENNFGKLVYGVVTSTEQLNDILKQNTIFINAEDDYYTLREKIYPLLKENQRVILVIDSRNCQEYENFVLNVGSLLTENLIQGAYVYTNEVTKNWWENVLQITLQESGAKRTRNEYISCPSCARTLFDIEAVTRQVKQATKNLAGYKIAVMGCIVNGPGEMHDADFGIVGAGKNLANLYFKGRLIARNLDVNQAIKQMLQLIDENNCFSHREDR